VSSSIAVAAVPGSAFVRDPYPQKPGPVQVFILAGQSNMQGQASLRTLEYLVYHPDTAARYEHLKDPMGDWVRRDDVWVWTVDGPRWGSLRPGFGASPWKFGPELGFGWAMAGRLDRQLLLVKTCWGGKSLRRDFLPPGSALPSEEELRQELERYRRKKPEATLEEVKSRYGDCYRSMIGHVRRVLDNLDQYFPDYDEKAGYELAGFVWFQGWNDKVDGRQRAEKYAGYTERSAQLIRDVRAELASPNLPVVIGELGVGGQPGDFQRAQRAAAELPEFQGTVRFVQTHQFWDPELEEMVRQGLWKGPEWPRFYNRGSDRGYHYLGSGKIMYQMGTAFGQAMAELLEANGR